MHSNYTQVYTSTVFVGVVLYYILLCPPGKVPATIVQPFTVVTALTLIK